MANRDLMRCFIARGALRVEPHDDRLDRVPIGAALDQTLQLAKLVEVMVDLDRPGLGASSSIGLTAVW